MYLSGFFSMEEVEEMMKDFFLLEIYLFIFLEKTIYYLNVEHT